jgi:PPOX class probable F420-dependent enzyme
MVKLNSAAKKLLSSETIIWLTTIGSDLTPQPRPVWFVPNSDDVLIYSQPKAAKVAHIRKHPNVALHFNADKWGSDENRDRAHWHSYAGRAAKSPVGNICQKVQRRHVRTRHDPRRVRCQLLNPYTR